MFGLHTKEESRESLVFIEHRLQEVSFSDVLSSKRDYVTHEAHCNAEMQERYSLMQIKSYETHRRTFYIRKKGRNRYEARTIEDLHLPMHVCSIQTREAPWLTAVTKATRPLSRSIS